MTEEDILYVLLWLLHVHGYTCRHVCSHINKEKEKEEREIESKARRGLAT